MKRILILWSGVLSHMVSAQINLKQCVESGWANRDNIKSARSEVFLASLKNIESKAKYLPQISLVYDYRYNPIIATQIVPVGQFNPSPSDETRAIQFGTNWQQNAAITLYQPLIDFAVQSRIKESKLNESISGIDLKKTENDLSYEILKSYSRVINFGYQLEESQSDTLRSFQTYSMLKAKFSEGKVLKTELNNALVNHHNNVRNYKQAFASLVNEKIYLHYLTNISLERLLDETFSPIPSTLFAGLSEDKMPSFDSVPELRRLKIKEQLLQQQIKTERAKYLPTIGIQGYLGANQFSQTFDPFLDNSWFGNCYVGLSVKLPLFSPDKSINGGKQLQTQLLINNSQTAEVARQRTRELLQKDVEIERLKAEASIIESSVLLQSENVKLYQQRLQNGQYTAIELNTQETELQKLGNQLKQIREQLNLAQSERVYLSGSLSERILKQ